MAYLVGYGSLVSHRSLSKTIPDRHFVPVIVKGYRRIFNISPPTHPQSTVLNVEKDRKARFNGVMFEIDDKDLPVLMRRESLYNLEKGTAYEFLTGKRIGKAFIVVDHVVGITKNHPNKDYFLLCREAAYHTSEAFGKFWDETTVLGDGTPVKEWLRENPSWDTISSRPAGRTRRRGSPASRRTRR